MLKGALLSALLLVLCLSNCNKIDQDYPIRGLDYVIHYENKRGLAPDNLQLVYTFDYWGTTTHAFQGSEALFLNVLSPDSGRARKIQMEKKDTHWVARITIPDSVSLLSYYFTDGKRHDYNDNKTYVRYIYNKNGKPVKNARFRNIDFLIMADHSKRSIIAEIEAELEEYPNNWIARTVYWRKTFENTRPSRLDAALERAHHEYGRLKENLGPSDTLENFKANYLLDYRNSVRGVSREKFEKATDDFLTLMESIPPENRYGYAKRFYQGYLDMMKIQAGNVEFLNSIVGSLAPDFQFKSITGNTRKLSEYRGNYVLLDFWGTWCAPCVGDIPDLKLAFETYNKKGFKILSICCDRLSVDDLKKYTSEKEMKWTHVLEQLGTGSIQKLYFVTSYPSLFLISPNGKVLGINSDIRGELLLQKLKEIYQD